MMKAHRLAALAAALFVGSVTPANALPVTYRTDGLFTWNDNTGQHSAAILNQNGVQIQFIGSLSTTLNPPVGGSTNALFGTFITLAAPSTPATLNASFTLTITQSVPGPASSVTFTGPVTGFPPPPTLGLGVSSAGILFNAASRQPINVGGVSTFYQITEGDESRPGFISFLSLPNQSSTLNGEVGVTAVIPEPGTMALACIALPIIGLGYARRRQTAKV